MQTETINQIKELLAPIGEKIGQGAEFGWQILVKQQIVEAYTSLLVLVLGIILTIFTVHLAKKSDWRSDSPPGWNEMISAICGIIGLIALLIGLIYFLSVGIGQIVNLEFYAIKFFIGLVK